MSRKIALFCAFLGVLAFVAAPAYAEVQNIKVSGDINAMGVYRNNFNLEDSKVIIGDPDTATSYIADDTDSFLLTAIRVRIDADLTDNVSTTVGLANLREWDVTNTADNDIVLDLAYITLKEMLYSPLTLVIGRQNLNYGNGLVLGYGLYQDANDIKYNELSPLNSHDAIRAILDYDPWTLDFVALKLTEADDTAESGNTTRDTDSDIDLYGANLGYTFDRYDAEVEGYLFYKRNPAYDLTFNTLYGTQYRDTAFVKDELYTLGLRGSLVPMDNLTLSGEIAGQFGEMRSDGLSGPGVSTEILKRDHEALAVNAAAEYDFVDVRFNPILGVDYLYTSGEEAESDGDWDAWDPILRGKVMGSIRDSLENFGLNATNDPADTSGWTNQHTIKVNGEVDLGEFVDGLSVDLAYLHYWFDEEPIKGADDNIGDELNLKVTYDYTEDVEFALNGAWFIPGDYYNDVHPRARMYTGAGQAASATAQTPTERVSNDTAVSIIGSCKVTF